MSVNSCTSSAVVDKNVCDPTAVEAPMPDKPASGSDDKEDKGDNDEQGAHADQGAAPEGGDEKEGKDATAGATPMEEVTPEAKEGEPTPHASYVQTYFVIGSNKSSMTPSQKGQLV